MLTKKQNAIYRPLVKRAWRVFCDRTGKDTNDRGARESWYRRELVSSLLGIYTTKQVQTGAEFDAICLHFATLAGDPEAIDYWTRADERRALWRLKQTMRNAGVDWPYVHGITRNMGYSKPIDDLPAALILKINTAVYLYWKRQAKRNAAV